MAPFAASRAKSTATLCALALSLAAGASCGRSVWEGADACYDVARDTVRVDFGCFGYGMEAHATECSAVIGAGGLVVRGTTAMRGRATGEDMCFDIYATCQIFGGEPEPDTVVTFRDETLRFADFVCE